MVFYQKKPHWQSFFEHSNSRTVLLLDEIGLAEYSPDMPLKVLHRLLTEAPDHGVSVIGLSNWVWGFFILFLKGNDTMFLILSTRLWIQPRSAECLQLF
jgi:hypothetical protein